MVEFSMNKKYQKLLAKEKAEFRRVSREFEKLAKAYGSYANAMIDRMNSAKAGGKLINDHTVDVTNSHQKEIDNLRDASLVFGEKIGGRGFRKALDIFHKMHDEIFDVLEMDSGTIL